MPEQKIERMEAVAENFLEAAEKVEDGINKSLEPEIKEARISSNEASGLVKLLAKRVTIFLILSFLLNAGAVLIFLTR